MEQIHDKLGLPFTPLVTPIVEQPALLQLLTTARKHQAVLSWDAFLHSHHPKEWIKVQELHERTRKLSSQDWYSQVTWSYCSIKIISSIIPDIWGFWNECVHGKTAAAKQTKIREAVAIQVTEPYAQNPALLPRYGSVRAMSQQDRLKSPTTVLQMWLNW
jgi:hypothetical protein